MYSEEMSKKLCFSLISCNSEDDVTKILNKNDFTNNPNNWIPLGKNKDNASIVQNTAGNLGSCLTELTTNAIDAVIQYEKKNLELNNIDIPKECLTSPEKFLTFALRETYTDSQKLNTYAKDKLKLLTTETPDGKRSLTVIDRGCGQKAENFGDTFCSVGSGHQNKSDKSWLHGNYGQGSTSGNAISGTKGYKLIISRENEEQNWGFTIIRRSPLDPSMLEYLIVSETQTVCQFKSETIEMGVRVDRTIAKQDGTLIFGSAVKLYSVKVEKGFVGVKRTLGGVLFRPALPVNSLEYSDSNEKGNKANGRDTRWIYGLGKFLDECVEKKEAELNEFELYCPVFKGSANIRIYFLREKMHVKSVLDWLPTSYSEKNKRFFHINNGQVQHTDPVQKLGRLYPKSGEHIFVEIDLSGFDQKEAKAYLWKADRTSFQTSTDHFQLYDKSLESYFSNSEQLKKWEKICSEDEMSKVKTAKNSQTDDVLISIFAQFNPRESKQHKATKKLIQTEFNELGTHVMGLTTSISDSLFDNEDKVEVEGKEIPTFISSENSTRNSAKTSNKKNLVGSLKTDAKKGSVGSKYGANKLKIKTASYIRDNQLIEIDIMKLNLSITQSKHENDIQFTINATDELNHEINVDDTIMIEFEMTNSLNKTTMLTSVVYFKLIECLKEVQPKTARANKLIDLINKGYATKDGRKWGDEETTNLMQFHNELSWDQFGYHILNTNESITILMNLDNLDLKLKMDKYKDKEDKVSYLKHWEASLIFNVINEYEILLEKNDVNLHELTTKLNNYENANLANRNAIHSAMRMISQEEIMLKKSLKVA